MNLQNNSRYINTLRAIAKKWLINLFVIVVKDKDMTKKDIFTNNGDIY